MDLLNEWISASKETLKLIGDMASKKPRDRLDLLNLMNLSLYAMAKSLLDWYQRLENPETLSMLSDEELQELAGKISKIAKEFVKYDIKTTRRFSKRGVKSDELKTFEDLYSQSLEDLLSFEDEEGY
ncbi:MAG: hypothetical protein DRJ98_00035 [Thermoprotei archaeon]|nr:MAG: hypothetical protein DRJ98_00035 [Thermoprotei archaeon]RLF18450.1 MAG: hypothetical protein DRN06_01495 [Thermoprotei archaeon]